MRTEVFIGIDISKPRLDVFNLATGELLEFDNSPVGIQAFVKFAKKANPTLLVCESTGGLEQALLSGCSEAKLPLAVVNPRQVRDFSRRTGPVGAALSKNSSQCAPTQNSKRWTPCCKVFPVWDLWCQLLCSRACLNWAEAREQPSPLWSGLRR